MRTNCMRFGQAWRSARALVGVVLIGQVFLLLASAPVLAQSPDQLAALNRQIGALVAKGDGKAVVPLAQRYADLARKARGENDPEYATAITWLAWAYQNQQRYADAEPLLKQALAIRETAFGPNHPLVATSLNNLIALYQNQGREAEIEPLFARVQAIRVRAVGMSELETLSRRIQQLGMEGKGAEAAKLAERYVALAEKRYGADQPDVVPALLEAAIVFEQGGDKARAEALLKQALAVREKAFGADSPEVADSLMTLAWFYQTAGRYGDAEAALKRAHAIRKTVFGERSEKALESSGSLSYLYQSAGRTKEAEVLNAEIKKLQAKMRRRYAYMRETEPSYAVVKVYYATDRKNTGATDPAEVYAGDRGPLTFGFTTVSIPRDHRMGAVETPSIWRLEWSNDPERFVVLLSVNETDEAQFFKDIAARVKKSAGKSAFVFVHGYNVTFADAARRTAQMAYDLGFDGAPVFYSWPSQASYASYKVDETNAEWSRVDFKTFLKDVRCEVATPSTSI